MMYVLYLHKSRPGRLRRLQAVNIHGNGSRFDGSYLHGTYLYMQIESRYRCTGYLPYQIYFILNYMYLADYIPT